ncbi:hypothetical protein SESBI_03660 [Sesbania bispinosa]|nr:hypothetical protein SESBI_03660 [Sesbania bispinosa]
MATPTSKEQVVDLLKCSLLSMTPLTDVFLLNKPFNEKAEPFSVSDFDIGDLKADQGHVVKLKVVLRKSRNTILFALGEQDFVDLILSFLTFPLGGVEHMLDGKSCMGSIDNLYKNILDLDCNTYLTSRHLKDKLVKSQLAHQFKLHNQILPIDEVPTSNYSCFSSCDSNGKFSAYLTASTNYRECYREIYAPLSYLEPQSSSTGEAHSKCGGKGFVKRPSLYMVTDDLVITPSTSVYATSLLIDQKIPFYDLEERVVNIGIKEGLSLLKASLTSSSALTNGLHQFLKPVNESIAV